MTPCSWISLDAMDISGELKFDLVSQPDVASPPTTRFSQEHEVYRRRLDPSTGGAVGKEERHDIVDGKFVGHRDIDVTNKVCGSCYGAEDAFFPDDKRNVLCCQTCKEVPFYPQRSLSTWNAFGDRCTKPMPNASGIDCRTRWCISVDTNAMRKK